MNVRVDTFRLAGDVHVVRCRLDAYGNGSFFSAVLDDEERRRAGRFVQHAHRRRFVVSHGLLRHVLGRYLAIPPAAVRYRTQPGGKPAIATGDSALEFNLSHSGEIALVAIARARSVGIDVEGIHPVETLQLARRFFAASEHAALCAIEPERRLQAFFRCWTRKEAYVKGRGEGLSLPLDSFAVTLDEGHVDTLPGAVDTGERRWSIVPVATDAGYVAALAVEGHPVSVTGRDAADFVAAL